MSSLTGPEPGAPTRAAAPHHAPSPSYVRAMTMVVESVSAVLERSGYQPMLTPLLPADSSSRLPLARLFRTWLAQGAALPLRYHLLWPGRPGHDGAPRPQARGHCALRTAQDGARQRAGDTRCVHDIAETLDVRHVGSELLHSGNATAFFADGADGPIRFAEFTDHGADGRVVPGAGGAPAHLTSLHIELTALTDLFLLRNPGLEATR